MKIKLPIALVIVVALSAAIGWALSQGSSPRRPRPPVVRRAVARPKPGLPKGTSYVAVARGGTLEVFRGPDVRQRSLVLNKAISAGAQLTVLVRKVQPGAVQIYLPVRPNGSTGWVKARDVKLLTDHLALTVRLRSRRLVVAESGKTTRTIPIGVGRAVTPTPTGTYYITELLKQPDPGGAYGPYAYGLSAYSGVIQQFGRGGNGQVGIHGTNEPQLVGTNVSHGCIRLRNSDIVWLTKRLPLGTPVSINRD
jgi:lipoprotein-anchoring transpeptidase ErfK/SrfK